MIRLSVVPVLLLGLPLHAQSTASVGMPANAPAPQAQPATLGDPCPPAVVRKVIDPTGLNALDAILAVGLPTFGNPNFQVKLDDALDTCTITPGSQTWVIVADEPLVDIMIHGGGCLPGTDGVLVVNVFSPSFHVNGPVTWAGPGMPACHTLVVPNDPAMCGIRCVAQGLWIDFDGPTAPFVLTEPLRFIIGS